MKLILASQSIYKIELLNRLGFKFSAIDPQVDEGQYKLRNKKPKQISEALAMAKASSVWAKLSPTKQSESIVIGCDQVLALKSTILSKPGNFKKAQAQLKMMSGKRHKLLTSICILKSGSKIVWTSKAVLNMKVLSSKQIVNYLKKDKPFNCAGSYMFEKSGIGLFQSIKCEDESTIVGLPLIKLAVELEKFGLKVLT